MTGAPYGLVHTSVRVAQFFAEGPAGISFCFSS
jgi:hypothetical protein